MGNGGVKFDVSTGGYCTAGTLMNGDSDTMCECVKDNIENVPSVAFGSCTSHRGLSLINET